MAQEITLLLWRMLLSTTALFPPLLHNAESSTCLEVIHGLGTLLLNELACGSCSRGLWLHWSKTCLPGDTLLVPWLTCVYKELRGTQVILDMD